jgi:hypothetical protein
MIPSRVDGVRECRGGIAPVRCRRRIECRARAGLGSCSRNLETGHGLDKARELGVGRSRRGHSLHHASDIRIRKAQSDQWPGFDTDVLNFAPDPSMVLASSRTAKYPVILVCGLV